jgi:hypothetical protein
MYKEDPRPDLKEDSDLWTILLTTAFFSREETLYENFHDFRIAGCRLSLNRERRNLAFNFGTEADETKRESIKKLAQQHTAHIKGLFKRVYRGIIKAEAQ